MSQYHPRKRMEQRFMWNDTDIPLGYLLTFRCYGTWLHGDQRGSTDRFHNRYKSPHLSHSARRHSISQRLLKSPPVILNAPLRKSVEVALRLHAFCLCRRAECKASNNSRYYPLILFRVEIKRAASSKSNRPRRIP